MMEIVLKDLFEHVFNTGWVLGALLSHGLTHITHIILCRIESPLYTAKQLSSDCVRHIRDSQLPFANII